MHTQKVVKLVAQVEAVAAAHVVLVAVVHHQVQILVDLKDLLEMVVQDFLVVQGLGHRFMHYLV